MPPGTFPFTWFRPSLFRFALELHSRAIKLREHIHRLQHSAVAWSWIFNGLRMSSGFLLLPLLLVKLSKPDLGMYYLFLSLTAVAMVLDFGFSPTLGRFIHYAMGGARRLMAHGLDEEPCGGEPNYPLVVELLTTARVFYALLAAMTILVLGIGGSVLVAGRVAETTHPTITWTAWALSVLAVGSESYFQVWNMFLRNINQVTLSSQIMALAYATRLLLAALFLLAGGGLLSLPAATLVGSVIIRVFSRRGIQYRLPVSLHVAGNPWRQHFRTLWPNSWRLGVYFAAGYLTSNASVLICSSRFGLDATAEFGLSLQIVMAVHAMASTWVTVKWPMIGQLMTRRDVTGQRAVLRPRIGLQMITYLLMALGAAALGPWLLSVMRGNKQMLPTVWFCLLGLNGLLESHLSTWNTLIAVGNRLPMLWPSVITNLTAVLVNLTLVQSSQAQPGLLVLGPLLCGALFNYWYWPGYGARTLQLSYWEFVRYGSWRTTPRMT